MMDTRHSTTRDSPAAPRMEAVRDKAARQGQTIIFGAVPGERQDIYLAAYVESADVAEHRAKTYGAPCVRRVVICAMAKDDFSGSTYTGVGIYHYAVGVLGPQLERTHRELGPIEIKIPANRQTGMVIHPKNSHPLANRSAA